MSPPTLEELALRGRKGDAEAVEALARALKDDIYRLAMRMLSVPADAEDATQEILVQIVTHLGQYRSRSRFRTWAWAIATRHLLRCRKGRREKLVSFGLVESMIREGDREPSRAEGGPEAALLAEEVRIGCTGAMLLALDREHRIAYILGEIFELSDREASRALGVPAATYRKRVSRARKRLTRFMRALCGLADPAKPCRCSRQIGVNIRHGTVDPKELLFATHPRATSPVPPASERLREADEIERIAQIFRSHPAYVAPDAVVERIRDLLRSGRYRFFEA